MSTVEMRKLIVDLEILLEFKLIDGYLYQNPNEKQTENLLKKFNELRGIFYDENVYVWNSYEKIHGAVMRDTLAPGAQLGPGSTYDHIATSFMISQFGNDDDEYDMSYWKDKFFVGIVGTAGGFNAEARKQFQKLLSQPLVKRAFGPKKELPEAEALNRIVKLAGHSILG